MPLVGLILILDTGIKIAEMTLNEILELNYEQAHWTHHPRR
jgi:hypothetical protein